MKRLNGFAAGIFISVFCLRLDAAIATQTINYQGQLTDSSGVALDGNYNMSFEIFDDPSAGLQLWASVVSNVPVNKGLFNVELDVNTLSGAQLNANLYLQVTVNGQIMLPRKRLLASAFAYNANMLQGMVPGVAAGNIPVIEPSGRLNPGILSAPFPLNVTGTGSGFAAYVQNQNLALGQAALLASGYDGLSATAAGSAGTGVYGSTSGSDALARGVWGRASAGTGLRGSSSSGLGLRADSASGLGAYAGGLYGMGLSGTQLGLRVGGSDLSGQSFSTPAKGIEVFSSGTGIDVLNNGSGNAVLAVNNGTAPSVYGRNSSANGVGVLAEHTPASGFGIGAQGLSNSSDGKGLEGRAGSLSGTNFGVYGISNSPGGFGVYGTAPGKGVQGVATAASGYGIYGLSQGDDGRGVQGEATGLGAAVGLYGKSSSVQGTGVYGESPRVGVEGLSSAETAGAVGVKGSAPLAGVLGEATKPSGPGVNGVTGRTFSVQGAGVLGEAAAAGPGQRQGVVGRAIQPGGLGTGVLGVGNQSGVRGESTGGTNQYGVYGHAAGSGNYRYGVHGSVYSATANEIVYAVYGEITPTANTGYAVYGLNNNNGGFGIRAFNVAARNSLHTGYALGVTGKFKVTEDNAGRYSFSGVASSWDVFVTFCGSSDRVLITPVMDVTSGGSVPNHLWVDSIIDGRFTVKSANPVANVAFDYLVISK